MESCSFKYEWAYSLVNTLNIIMKKARDLILKLYKENNITKEEVDILLDAINQQSNKFIYQTPPQAPWALDTPCREPYWTVTCNTQTNVE